MTYVQHRCVYCGQDCGPLGAHDECLMKARGGAAPSVALTAHAASAPPPPRATPGALSVQVVDVSIPFFSVMKLMIKWALASIPAMMIAGAIFAAMFLTLITVFYLAIPTKPRFPGLP